MMATDDEPLDAEFKPLAIREEQPERAPDLFGSADPVEIVEKAVRVADALKSVIVAKNLISNIQGKAYPQVEAWLTLASMLRLTTVCEWSRRVDDGWEARVFVRDGANNVIGAAEAQCLKTERTKKAWEDYAIRSMAQTRATSKALRSVLGFIMVLAGYQATPAEEMPNDAPVAPPEPPSTPPADVDALKALWEAKGKPLGTGRAFVAKHGSVAAAIAKLEVMPDAADVAEAFAPDELVTRESEAFGDQGNSDTDPREKEKRRMFAICQDRNISDAVRRMTLLRLFGPKCMTDGKPSSKGLSHAQLVQANFELEAYKP
jgi:hypothetical protein